MRTIALLIALTCLACDRNKTESSEIARKQNNEQFETWEQKKEADFIVDAVAEHYASIRFAQLAMNKTSNPDIRDVAASIEMEQAQELKKFTGFANKKGISIPIEENESARDKLNELANQQRAEFEEKWCKDLAKRNEHDIQTYESMWEKTSDSELKDLINESLPEMRTHLVKLRSCQEKLAMN
jgi:putative membrane protein